MLTPSRCNILTVCSLRTDKNRINVMHITEGSNSNEDLRLVTSDFSESMARVMSPFINARLPAKRKLGAGVDLSRPLKSTVIIQGCDHAGLCKALSWMIGYCGGKTDLPVFASLPLSNYLALLEAAELLGLSVLIEQTNEKISPFRHGHADADDILAVLERYPPSTNHANRTIAAEAFASAMFKGVVDAQSEAMAKIGYQDQPFVVTVYTFINAKQAAKFQYNTLKAQEVAANEAKREAEQKAKMQKRAVENKARRTREKALRKAQEALKKAKEIEEVEAKRQEAIDKGESAQSVNRVVS